MPFGKNIEMLFSNLPDVFWLLAKAYRSDQGNEDRNFKIKFRYLNYAKFLEKITTSIFYTKTILSLIDSLFHESHHLLFCHQFAKLLSPLLLRAYVCDQIEY